MSIFYDLANRNTSRSSARNATPCAHKPLFSLDSALPTLVVPEFVKLAPASYFLRTRHRTSVKAVYNRQSRSSESPRVGTFPSLDSYLCIGRSVSYHFF